MRDPATLKPNPKNPRTHSDEQIKMIRASIDEFGWTVPCVIDEKDKLWGGHGRALAAQLEPAIPLVPCVVARGWTAAQKTAYMLADNRIGEVSTWDRDLLRDHLKSLDGVFDLAKAGFDAIMLPQFLADPNPGRVDPEETPEPPADPVSRLGDVWILGNHRLAVGDSTNAETVAAALGDLKPKLMVTDSPYGVNYDANWRNEVDRANGKAYGARAVGLVKNDDRSDWREAWALFPGDVAYCWHADRHASSVQVSLESVGFEIVCQVIWAKNRLIISRGDYHWQHEPCWYAVKKGKRHNWSGDRSQTTLWAIEHAKSDTGHSTQKPIECMRRPIENNSKPGDAVYDPFVGSGTTIISCEMMGRKAVAIELNPAYADVCITRWETFSGGRATLLDSAGRTFAEISDERKAGRS